MMTNVYIANFSDLAVHLITFDVPITPARFQQKYGFRLPSKLALGNVVVFGRDKYDGVGAVKRFKVVGYKICQVYNGYDDWQKNVKEEELRHSDAIQVVDLKNFGR